MTKMIKVTEETHKLLKVLSAEQGITMIALVEKLAKEAR